MPRVVPSQVVELIDKLFPWAKDQREATKRTTSLRRMRILSRQFWIYCSTYHRN